MELRQLDRADVAPTTIVVFDDLSDDPATQEILRLISDRGHEVISSAGRAPDDAHGNLFANMNRALDLAGARGFRLLHLVQDDLQLVRRCDELADRVLAILDAFPDACQVMVHFMRRLGITYPVPVVEQRAYRMNSIGDLGFVDVRRLEQRGFRFQSSERARLPPPPVARGARSRSWTRQRRCGERVALPLLRERFAAREGSITVFDAGANVGDYTDAVLAELGERAAICAFEPARGSYQALAARVAADRNVRAFNLGLSDERRQAKLFIRTPGAKVASLHGRHWDQGKQA